jgi:uncharacterized membrane protein YkvA (DUF1232 family)
MMKGFDALLEEDIASYEGRHDEIIFQAPAFYRLLVRLLDDPLLPRKFRPLVLAAIAYFILPADIIPEDIYGPEGYMDDIFLCACVAEHIGREVGGSILEQNWEGESPVLPLIGEIIDLEHDLIGEEKQKILDYIGAEELLGPGEMDPEID